MYVRLTRGLVDKGVLVPADKYQDYISNRETQDWYISPYFYGEDAFKYFQEHENSIKGYQGKVWTNTLYWDLDSEDNVELSRSAAVRMLEKLQDLNLLNTTEVFFSGNKGFHIVTKVTNKFTPDETTRICSNIAYEAGLKSTGEGKTFDTTVYNTNRIFRINNTVHKTSNLFKIPLLLEEVDTCDVAEIRELAKAPRKYQETNINRVDAAFLKEKYNVMEASNVVNLLQTITSPEELDLSKCPPNKRRCIYILENGHFDVGERNNACMRLAAYYRGQGFSKEHVYALVRIALDKRLAKYDDDLTESELQNVVEQIFDKGWNGGTYTCSKDAFLANKCSINGVPCSLETTANTLNESRKARLITIDDLVEDYTAFGDEALKDYPKFGLSWLDEQIRIIPQTFSIINGAVGSGKTSLMINYMESLNKQKIHHLFCSLDMSKNAIFEKIGTRHTNFSQRQINAAFNIHTRDDLMMRAVIKVLKEVYPYTVFDFTSAATVKHIQESVELCNKDKAPTDKVKVVIVDYAGRLIGEQMTILANALLNSNKINDVAKETRTHIMLLSQVSRVNGDLTDPLFSSRVSKETSGWEENATFMINCWRPFGDNLSEFPDKYFHIYIAKNRSSQPADYVLSWEGKTGKIKELTLEEYNEALDHFNKAQVMFPTAQHQYVSDKSLIEIQRNLNQVRKKKKGGHFNGHGGN